MSSVVCRALLPVSTSDSRTAVAEQSGAKSQLTGLFAELKDPVRSKLERDGLARPPAPDRFFPTLGAAVEAFRAQVPGHWSAPRQES